ncbi:chymotrypsin-C-like isoform X2 [Sitophilus oryzae]|uniref:Chymotrypsin-C-like isoform X2 n=1 Tax=Sitophilus oryzae TaxID=7048 RepID=A0A6J2X9F3_SITOR|nr:chymotrypsin-C-like isoform X2 [Sitophilus oryzae]
MTLYSKTMIAVYLLIIKLFSSGYFLNPNLQCKNVTVRNIHHMCTSLACFEELPALEYFCTNVYENIFKCSSKNIPIEYICDGIQQCRNGVDEDPTVCKNFECRSNYYKCIDGKCIAPWKLCDGVYDCLNGLDESALICRMLLLQKNNSCPNIFDNSYITTCYIKYGTKISIMPCNEYLPVGTTVEVRCNTFYLSSDNKSKQKLVCRDNGTWSQTVLKCKAECGVIPDLNIFPSILHGWPIKPNLWPWYAGLFENGSKKWNYFCGSTIISTNIVVTAAHCVWEIPKNHIQVIAGKYKSDYYINEEGTQIKVILHIFIHPLYQDVIGNYATDLAVLVLVDHFQLSNTVIPICLNWSLRNIVSNLTQDLEGMVIGMGLTENGKPSEQLRAVKMPIVNNDECLINQRVEFKKFISITTFCAGSKNGSTVCNGDSGSGLAIQDPQTQKWYLEGIVSISPKDHNNDLCDVHYYSIFTNVGMYVDWIYQISSAFTEY